MLPVISEPESLTSPTTTGDSDTAASDSDILADQYRRIVVRYLETQYSPVSLSDLADEVTLEQRDQSTGSIANWGDAVLGTRRRVRLSLRHNHVPRLADAGIVDFDRDTNTVSLQEHDTQ